MSGLVALVGGCEHQQGWEPIGRDLLDRTGAGRPRVALVPVASSPKKQPQAIERARAYWAGLGVVFGVADLRGGEWQSMDALAAPDVVFLSGGVPGRLHAALAGSWIWARIVDLWLGGAILAGSSAGAMELLAWRLAAAGPRPLVPGLGALEGAVVAPHFDRYGMRRCGPLVARSLGGLALVGIDERTALVGRAGRFRTVGEGAVTVVRRGGPSVHRAGGEFPLNDLREAVVPLAATGSGHGGIQAGTGQAG